MSSSIARLRGRERELWPWAVVAVGVAAQSVVHVTNELVLDGRYRWLDAAVDSSVFGRANTAAIAVSAALVGFAALQARRPTRRLILCVCLLLVMADDATGIHDRLRDAPRAEDALLGMAVAGVLALTLGLLLAEAAVADRGPKRLLIFGLCALVAAVAVRVIAAFSGLGTSLDTTARAVGVAGEQGLDFGGWLLVAGGLLGALAAERGSAIDEKIRDTAPVQPAGLPGRRRDAEHSPAPSTR